MKREREPELVGARLRHYGGGGGCYRCDGFPLCVHQRNATAEAKRRSLHRHVRLGVPGVEGVHVRQHEVPRAIGPERRLVLTPDDLGYRYKLTHRRKPNVA